MAISSFGDNLTVLIQCENQLLDHWLAYASWYSVNTNLPHALVKILVKRTEDNNPYFSWASRRDVNCYRHCGNIVQDIIDRNKYADRPYLIIRPYMMAIREFDNGWLNILNDEKGAIIGDDIEFWNNSEENKSYGSDNLCVDTTESEITTFVRYSDFGNFVCSEWINKRVPFVRKIKSKTINEKKAIYLWNRAHATIDL